MKASDVYTRIGTLLNDVSHVRWPTDELLLWVGDAQIAICVVRPDAHTEDVEFVLTEGAAQELPDEITRLFDVTHNITVGTEGHFAGRAITITDREEMDRFDPTWRSARSSKTVKQFMHDANHPRVFYVTPPNNGEGLVNATCATLPDRPTDANSTLPLDDRWLDALTYYVAAKCYSKDGEFVPRAGEYLQLFVAQLSGEQAASRATQPNVAKAGGKPDLLAQQMGGV